MLRELLTIFRSESPLQKLAAQFSEMLEISLDLIRRAGTLYFAEATGAEERTILQKKDVRINKLQRRIRKKVIVHLSLEANRPDLPYCLLLMNLVKDVERIGDLAKELADLVDIESAPLPEGRILSELTEIRSGIESDYESALEVIQAGDRERAIELIDCGRDTVARCQQLVRHMAHSGLESPIVVRLVLATRFYQRIAGHVLNLLSSAVVPLHKLDYYDEDDIAKAEKKMA
jgi:phosphate uptake regulator